MQNRMITSSFGEDTEELENTKWNSHFGKINASIS